jgi:hypothetical protein
MLTCHPIELFPQTDRLMRSRRKRYLYEQAKMSGTPRSPAHFVYMGSAELINMLNFGWFQHIHQEINIT